MKIRLQVEPTDIVTEIDGVPVRVWNGIHENGSQIFLFVHRVAVRDGDPIEAELLRDLYAMPIKAMLATKKGLE